MALELSTPTSPGCLTDTDFLERTMPVDHQSDWRRQDLFSSMCSSKAEDLFSSINMNLVKRDSLSCPTTPMKRSATNPHRGHKRVTSDGGELPRINPFSPSGVVLGADDPRLSPLPTVRSPRPCTPRQHLGAKSPRSCSPKHMSRHHSVVSNFRLPEKVERDRLSEFLFWSADVNVSPCSSRRASDVLETQDSLCYMLDTDVMDSDEGDTREEGYPKEEAITYSDDDCVIYKVKSVLDGMFYSLKEHRKPFTEDLLLEVRAMSAIADCNSIGYKDCWVSGDTFYVQTDIMYSYYDIPHATGEDVTELGRGIFKALKTLHSHNLIHTNITPSAIVASIKDSAGIVYKLAMYQNVRDVKHLSHDEKIKCFEVDYFQLGAVLLHLSGFEEVFPPEVLEFKTLQEYLEAQRDTVASFFKRDDICVPQQLVNLVKELMFPVSEDDLCAIPAVPTSSGDYINLLRQAIEAAKYELLAQQLHAISSPRKTTYDFTESLSPPRYCRADTVSRLPTVPQELFAPMP
eukprot:TRINITY_DN37676_c0_g1_i1.p1 TRINITY_DN37676_c0_g1~~TRINITY_DN37676_c0_g1_i1.p1  ORF type:complete len:517 (+),score=109.66 TRINITY_DN37676_c0_g1_i1:40-1590(+)